MRRGVGWLPGVAFTLAGLVMSPVAQALDAGSLKLLVDELPYPQMEFGVTVALSVEDVPLLGSADPHTVLDETQQLLAGKPDDPEAHLRRGLALQVLRDKTAHEEYARAAELWRPIVAEQPDNVAARLGLAQALDGMGDWDGARPLVNQLAEQHPELWWPHFALGQRAMDALGRLVGMHRLGSLASAPADPQALGAWLDRFSQDWPAEMKAQLEKARQDPEAFRSLTRQLADTALAHLAQAGRAAPEEPAPRVLAVLVRLQLATMSAFAGETPNADALLTAGEELRALADELPAIPRLRLFAAFQHVTFAMARANTNGFLNVWDQFAPEDQQVLAADEVATRKLLETDAGRLSDTYELCAVYAMLHGDLPGALELLRQSTAYDPKSPERWEAYVGVLTQTEDLDAIRAGIDQALQQVSTGTLHCALAKVYQKQGDLPKAETELEAAIAVGDDQTTFAQVMLGVLRLKSGNAAGAIEPLQSASPKWREDGLCEAALALALAQSGREAEAAEHIKKAAELSPDNRLVARAADLLK